MGRMKKMKVLIGLVFGVLLTSPTMSENTAALQVIQGNGQFTNNLYKVLSQDDENLIFSPISVHAVLSMAYQGAQGTTSEKLASTLKIPDAKIAGEGYIEIIKRLNSVSNVTLLMANKVFVHQVAKLLPEFQTAVTKNFLSEVQAVDFGDNIPAAKTINSWVEEQTRDKIKDLITANDLNSLTRLVLVNAIYFKGDWKHKFDKSLTKKEPFYLLNGSTVDVDMMHIKKKFYYKNDEALGAQVLELKYVNEDISMIIILPNEKDGIKNVEAKLVNTTLADITKDMYHTEVNVALPRFKIESTIDLKEALSALGLEEMFDEGNANFKGMIELSGQENLYVSKVIQKAFIEVNEEGAEAAAATGMVMAMRCALILPRPTPKFIADHPFIYYLAEKSNTELFNGRIFKPE